jgi:hypothetical protein
MRPTPRPLVGAVSVCAAGFGVMTLFHLHGNGATAPKGHWDYLSGTIGDALLLPVCTALLLHLDAQTGEGGSVARVATIVGASAAGLVGTGVQAAWLLDPSPTLNWTLPEPHHLSAPGWYHAVFFVVMSVVVGGLAGRVAVKLRLTAQVDAPVQHLALPVAALFGCTACFLGLVVADSSPSITTSSSMSTVVACGIAMAAGVVGLTGSRGLRPLRFPAGLAVAAGFAAAGLIALAKGAIEW